MTTVRSADKAPSSQTDSILDPALHQPPGLRSAGLRSADAKEDSEPEGSDGDGDSDSDDSGGDIADGSPGRRGRPRPHSAQVSSTPVGVADPNEGRRAIRPGSRSRP